MFDIHNRFGTPFALLDIAGTVAGAYAVSYYFETSFPKTLIAAFALGVATHAVLKIDTPANRMLGLA